jgi:hypothetical protein
MKKVESRDGEQIDDDDDIRSKTTSRLLRWQLSLGIIALAYLLAVECCFTLDIKKKRKRKRHQDINMLLSTRGDVTSHNVLRILLLAPIIVAVTGANELKDYSSAVVGLFNNMRTPAALISGSIVPLGIMTAPTIQESDSRKLKVMKTLYIVLSVTSLLSEILAVTYASIAINKLVEVPQPATTGVAELIEQNHELAWVGTNIHFLFGMMGFALIVGLRVYFSFGERVGNLAIGWSVAAFLQALSIVNAGIAMGHGDEGDMQSRFASNFFFLNIRYIQLVAVHAQGGIARGGVCGLGAIAVASVTGIQTIRMFYQSFQEKDGDKGVSASQKVYLL